MTQHNFAENLRFLCSQKGSIADTSREAGLNRQQFNKYLSGRHTPSRRNLALIASFFGVAEKDLFLDPVRFSSIYGGRVNPFGEIARGAIKLERFASSFGAVERELGEALGVHYRYQASSIYDGRIVRAVTVFIKQKSVTRYQRIERFEDKDDTRRNAFSFRYDGFCSYSDGKLYLYDVETRQQNESTFAVLTPMARRPCEFMFGMAAGVSASTARSPYATRMALQYISPAPLRPSHLRQARTLPVDSPEIPSEVKDFLLPARAASQIVLRGG